MSSQPDSELDGFAESFEELRTMILEGWKPIGFRLTLPGQEASVTSMDELFACVRSGNDVVGINMKKIRGTPEHSPPNIPPVTFGK